MAGGYDEALDATGRWEMDCVRLFTAIYKQ